jgi:hypothetical protein
MFIEAHDEDHANSRAQRCGIYFDGVDKGIDCECCGDRWHNYPSKVDQLDGSFGESYAHPLDVSSMKLRSRRISADESNRWIFRIW